MGDPICNNTTFRATASTFQYGDGNNTCLVGGEARYNIKSSYIGLGGNIATDNFKNVYGVIDFKGKLNYDSKGIFEQNLRIRTAFDDELKSTQIRYSPLTVNVPITDKISIYNNLNYAAKHNYQTQEWTHSLSDFLGISINATKNLNISLEGQVYNLQDCKNFGNDDVSANIFVTWKF